MQHVVLYKEISLLPSVPDRTLLYLKKINPPLKPVKTQLVVARSDEMSIAGENQQVFSNSHDQAI